MKRKNTNILNQISNPDYNSKKKVAEINKMTEENYFDFGINYNTNNQYIDYNNYNFSSLDIFQNKKEEIKEIKLEPQPEPEDYFNYNFDNTRKNETKINPNVKQQNKENHNNSKSTNSTDLIQYNILKANLEAKPFKVFKNNMERLNNYDNVQKNVINSNGIQNYFPKKKNVVLIQNLNKIESKKNIADKVENIDINKRRELNTNLNTCIKAKNLNNTLVDLSKIAAKKDIEHKNLENSNCQNNSNNLINYSIVQNQINNGISNLETSIENKIIKYNSNSIPISELGSPLSGIFKFDNFNIIQSKCFDLLLKSNENSIISSPTGSGKTSKSLINLI